MRARGTSALLASISVVAHLVLVPALVSTGRGYWWMSYWTATPMSLLAVFHGWSLYQTIAAPSGQFRTISGIFAIASWGVMLSLLIPAFWVIHMAFQIVPFMLVNLMAPLLLFAYIAVVCAQRFGLMVPPNADNCLSCGYSLRGLPTHRCPECGHVSARNDDLTIV